MIHASGPAAPLAPLAAFAWRRIWRALYRTALVLLLLGLIQLPSVIDADRLAAGQTACLLEFGDRYIEGYIPLCSPSHW
jgi:hypothetical protein